MKCSLSWCYNKVHANGLCSGHCTNRRKYGVPNPPELAHIVGTRTILAKTCPVCGELKLPEEFGFHTTKSKIYVRHMCTPCKIVYNRSHRAKNPSLYRVENTPERQAKHNRYMTALNDKSRESASKHYDEYTSDELDVILRTDLSSREKAQRLHRTVRAINNKLYKMRKAERENAV